MNLARTWRALRPGAADVPRVGVRLSSTGAEITISVTQECLVALPPRTSRVPVVSVTIASQRPGITAHVSIGANFNSPDGSYQGPTTMVGQGQFTETSSEVRTRFVLMPSGFPVLGVGAVADYADGVHSVALTYEQIACNPWVWWGWVNRLAAVWNRRR